MCEAEQKRILKIIEDRETVFRGKFFEVSLKPPSHQGPSGVKGNADGVRGPRIPEKGYTIMANFIQRQTIRGKTRKTVDIPSYDMDLTYEEKRYLYDNQITAVKNAHYRGYTFFAKRSVSGKVSTHDQT